MFIIPIQWNKESRASCIRVLFSVWLAHSISCKVSASKSSEICSTPDCYKFMTSSEKVT